MQRIMVDLPEPDGPHTTMRSPGATSRLILRSTWNWPYHLFTSCMRMMASVTDVLPQWRRRPCVGAPASC
ncbi:Uncharacterised protein [Bordetella pertussis]|nr:Uncharacterised protein [Bordetella pertussis]